MTHYRALPAGALLTAPLDTFTAVYHRPSGITHLLVSPAPEILEALDDRPVSRDALMARLADRYDLSDSEPGSLGARLDELGEAGLLDTLS